ncbi:MAG: hypothetical protein LBG29_08960 [Synergistaceae bacterium]|jgi:hypothetical protein|nr:hypothetical protein [Synergistaceae bacterium]
MLDSPLWHPFFAEASDHLMPLSNLHFDKYAPRTETVDMTEKEYEERLMSLNGKMEKAYATISLSANGRKLESLARAQSAWLDMAEKYARVLRRTLDAEVKVFYGDKNKERITNIFRDNLMAIYEQRVMDLSRWAGSPKSTAFKPEKSVQELKLAIQDKGSHIEYVMNERYRMDESASREAWKKFCDAQEIFLRMFYGDEGAVEAELGLVYQRLMNLMMLQEQGVIFFHTEREE